MSANVNLKQLERKAWTSFYQDGLLDILMGLALLAAGIPALLPGIFTSELGQNAAVAVLMVPAVLVYWLGKKFVTVPRIGRAKFSRVRKSRQTKAAVIYAISVLAGVNVFLLVMLGLSSSPPAWVQRLGARGFLALAIGAWMLLIVGLGSYFVDFSRGYVIAALYALAFGGTVLVHNPIMFIIAGSMTVLMGVVVLIRFIREYPTEAQEAGTERD